MRFTLPRDVYFGPGTLDTLSSLTGARAMVVVGGGSMKRLGFLDRALALLGQAGMQTGLIENVEPDPSVDTVLRGAQAMRDFAPDWIVAMGGGSPIDAAKAMWVFYEHPETAFDSLITPFGFPPLRQKARFCAIPSTSGTATEVTAFSVITDNEKGVKYPLADYEITPDVAIVDPDLAQSMPPTLAAHTGLDALTHAVEAYVSTQHSPFTDPLALKAAAMVFEYLPASCGGDAHAREQMHYAQCLAGMAFTNALLGITHAMAHKTGAAFSTGHVAHGLANAVFMPYVIRFNSPAALARYADIARAVGVTGGTDSALVDGLITRIEELRAQLSVPGTLRACGVPETEFMQKVAAIAQGAVDDACTGANPRPINAQEMEKLLTCAYFGYTVSF